MFDNLGIVQHHDAVTGTARQHVADDYSRRLYNAMDGNNEEFFEIIGDKVFGMSGIESNEKWSDCLRTNSTYRDCPISYHVSKSNLTMTVAAYNPSTIDTNTVEIAIPNHNYTVKVWDEATKSLVETSSVVNCYEDYNESADRFDSCFMTVATTVKSRNI